MVEYVEHAVEPKRDTTNAFKSRNLKKLMFTFSAPAIVGTMVNAFYNVVNRVFVGHGAGELAIGGITYSFPIMLVFAAFGMMIGLGSNVLFSIKLGQRDKEGAELVLGNAFISLVVLSNVIALIIFIFSHQIFTLLGVSETIRPYAVAYTRVLLFGGMFNAVTMGLNNFIRSTGNPKTAMWTLLISAILNVVFDAVLIFGFGMGIRGAALGTVLAQMVAFVWVVYYFTNKRAQYKIRVKNFVINWANMFQAVSIGSAQFIMQMCISLVNAIFNKSLLKYGGDLSVAAMGITASVNLLLIMPIIGISQGMQPIVGYNYGARKYRVVAHTLRIAVTWALGVLAVGWVIVEAGAPLIVRMFNNENLDLIARSSHTLRIFNLLLPMAAFSILASGFFQATNKPKQAIFLALARQALFLVPLLIILPRFFGLNGVLYAAPASDLISTTIAFFMIRRIVNKYTKTGR
ncbi:putative efflux protein [Parelusimicrobium proximum]|uniref:MATE family efflux transporter n=1 Tax=Parelusimicrobium proximum TaxID=3228953 RepID=UPI003D1661D9